MERHYQHSNLVTENHLMRAVHNCCDGKKIAKLLLQNKIDKSYEWQTAGSHFRTTAIPAAITSTRQCGHSAPPTLPLGQTMLTHK